MSALTTHSIPLARSITPSPDPTPIPTVHHARARLAEVEHMLLTAWTQTLPDLETTRAERLCSAHRAVHEAMLLLEESEFVVAGIGRAPHH